MFMEKYPDVAVECAQVKTAWSGRRGGVWSIRSWSGS